MTETITIRVDPPLQCCALLAVQRRCRQPATAAQATMLPDGSYHVQAFCRSCAIAMAKQYGALEPKEDSDG